MQPGIQNSVMSAHFLLVVVKKNMNQHYSRQNNKSTFFTCFLGYLETETNFIEENVFFCYS